MPGHGRGDAGREVAIADQADARAGFANIGDELLMPRAVEHHDDQIVHAALQPPGDGFQVVLHRRVQIDRAFRRRADDDLFHVAVGRVQQAAALGCRQHGDGAAGAGGAEVGALQRIDRDIHRERAGLIFRGADFLADVEHGRLVALALADDDGAVDGDGIEAAAHALDRGLVGGVRIAHAHGAGRCDGRIFHHAQDFQREVEHATVFSSWTISQFWCWPIRPNRNWPCSKQLPERPRSRWAITPEAFERTAAQAERDSELGGRCARLFEQVWRMAPRVRWVHSRSAGLDDVLFPELVESPVPLTNARGVFSEVLAEFAIGAVLFFAKDFRRMVRSQMAGVWDQFDIVEIRGQTLGIIGYGDIGRAVAQRARTRSA